MPGKRSPAIFALWLTAACGRGGPAQTTGTLSQGTVATVGSDRIDEETVRRISVAEGITVAAARDRAVFDALFAAFAKEHFGQALARQGARTASARMLLMDFTRAANEQGPPTDAEVAEATERRFWELDRPPLLRTTHAVVTTKKPEDDSRAHALADRVLSAVRDARDPESFRRAATSVSGGNLQVVVQDLAPVARDGRAVDPAAPPPPGSSPAHYADAYVEAAYAIPEIGGKSPVVKTEFGYHVILAVERIPEKRVPLEERRRMLASEILIGRAEKLREDALAKARKSSPVEVERAASELTERVKAAE